MNYHPSISQNPEAFLNRIFTIQTQDEFEELALETFRYQAKENGVYKEFLSYLKIDPERIENINQIPFLPVEFFKLRKIPDEISAYDIIFTSSGTSSQETSKHYVKDISVYERSFMQGFANFYGDISEYCVLALLPSYLEREGSSLVYMCSKLIEQSNNVNSGFYLYDFEKLYKVLNNLNKSKQKTLLIGVSFALLDFAEAFPIALGDHIHIMETGGMKGRRKEIIREELHEILGKAFNKKHIHSEYGMTELLSQAYSKGDGIFICPPWMKMYCRDINDPMSGSVQNRSGSIHIIDLANLHSCAFIATQDIGKLYPNGEFEIMGRMDGSEQRGCNLLID